MNKQRILHSALDCISIFKNNNYPLKNIANNIIKLRKLNSQERRALLDLVFAWARQNFLVTEFLKDNLRFYQSLSEQDKNLAALKILSKSIESESYENYVNKLGDRRYELALGEFIREEMQKGRDDITSLAKSLFENPKKYLAFDWNYLDILSLKNELKKQHVVLSSHPIAPRALAVQGELSMTKINHSMQNNIWLMDAGSQIIAELIKPKAHERVLDMCAGEGGKARYITMNACEYTAMDIDEARLKHAKRRLAGKNIRFLCADARNAPLAPQSFDWILLDAPCSGTGVLRRHPDMIHRLDKHKLEALKQLQAELLQSAAKMLAPGGTLIYATCSLFECENKQQIERLLAVNKQLKPLPLGSLLVDGQLNLSSDVLNKNSLELIPSIHDCDGFYVACLRKT